MIDQSRNSESNSRKTLLSGVALVLCSALSWGFSGACIQYLTSLEQVDVNWLSWMRMTIAGILLVAFCLIRKKQRGHIKKMVISPKTLAHVAIYAVFGVFACQQTYMMTISYTNAGIGTMMEQLSQVLIMACGCFMARRLPVRKELVALALALFGVFCLCTQGDPTALSMPLPGLLWGLLSAVTMTTYVLIPVKLIDRFDSTTVAAMGMVLGSIILLPVLRPWTCTPTLTMPVVLVTIGTAMCGTLIAYVCFLEGVKRAGPIIAGLLDAAEPVFALLISAAWMGTPVSLWDGLGCVLIIGMVVLIAYPSKADRETASS